MSPLSMGISFRGLTKGAYQWALLMFIRIQDYIGPADPNFQNFEVRTKFCLIRTGVSFPSEGTLQTSTYQVYDYIAEQWTSDCGGGGSSNHRGSSALR